MEGIETLIRDASVLEELNKHVGNYVSIQDLLAAVKLSRPLLTRSVVKLQDYGYVERVEQGTKITEKGQVALTNKYSRIKKLVEENQ
jgi:CTP-dependent riboflavin kinase